jgi:hypothetical protein
MSVVAQIFESAGNLVGGVVETVGDVVGDVAEFAGDVVEKAADTVGNTVKGALDDPLGTIAQVATAVYAPYLLPAVSAGVTVANGGDFDDALKSAAISYAGAKVATGIGGELAGSGMDQALVRPATNIATGTLKGLAMGQDFGDALSGAATGTGLGMASGYVGNLASEGVRGALESSGLDSEYVGNITMDDQGNPLLSADQAYNAGLSDTAYVPPIQVDDQGNALLALDQSYNADPLTQEQINLARATGNYVGGVTGRAIGSTLQGDQGAPVSRPAGALSRPPALGSRVSSPTGSSSLSANTRQQQVADILGMPEFSPLSFGTKLAELGIDPSLASVIMNDPDTLRNLMSNASQSSYYTYGSTTPSAQSALGTIGSSPIQSTANAPIAPAMSSMAPAMNTAGVGAPAMTGGLPSLPTMAGMPKVAKNGGLISGYADGGHIPEFSTGAGMNYVRGRGDGQSDDIPAMLADGEYVFDSDIVSALGNGSNEAGARLLDKMRENIRSHKRSAPTNKIPPKAKSPLEYLKQAQKKAK